MTDRVPLIVGNWKMHRDHLEAIQLVQKTAYHLTEDDTDGQEVVVCPSFVALRSVQTLIQSDHLTLQLGAQDCHHADEGAFTGEVSARMLARLDVRYVIVGHSERRALMGEDDATVAAKARAVVRNGMRPIVCVGETLEEREDGVAVEVVATQLRGSLAKVPVTDPTDLVIAYEPVWAIGTGRTATPEDAQELCEAVRGVVAEVLGDGIAEGVRVLYGGSVKPGNIRSLMGLEDVDGVLVGGASILADDFALIVAHRR